MTGDLPAGELIGLANDFAVKAAAEYGVKVTEKKKSRLGTISAVRYAFEGGGIAARVTFFPFLKSTWRIVGAAPAFAANRYLGQILLTTRSFRPVTAESLSQIRINHLGVVLVRPGEDVVQLGERTGNVWTPTETALMNGMLGNEVFAGGELMKILLSERFQE